MAGFGKKLKQRRVKKKFEEMDITSLLDILTILLVFLLKSYNATDLKLEVAHSIDLPSSRSEDLGSHAIILQVNKNRQVFINNKLITQLSESGKEAAVLETILKEEAEKEKKFQELENQKRHIASVKDPAKNPGLKINLVFDKDLPYSVMGQILHYAATTNHSKFKFIVQGKE